MKSEIIEKLRAIVGSEHCTTRPEDLHCYSYDGRATPALPEAVVFPDSTQQVSEIMKLASRYRFPVIPRGAGTGMTGGTVAVQGGLIMAMTRLNRLLELDTANQIAIVEPGIITIELQRAAAKHNLFFPPDPASLKFSTVGGNAGECAGGPSAVKYGVTKDFIIGLEVVLPSGEIIHTGARTEKSVTGYDLTRLFVGAEGTLGVITKLICRLIPLPPKKVTFLINSVSLSLATELVAEILNHNIVPCTLEYMDRTAISVVADFMTDPPPPGTEALLLLELDGDDISISRQSEALRQLLETKDGITVHHASSNEEVAKLWQARRSISPAAFALKPHKLSEDVAVPRSRIPQLVSRCEELSRESGLTILTFGHAGDGNIHVNIMLDKDDPRQLTAGEQVKEKLFVSTIDLGGTLSGEHGIGTTKAKFLPLELSPATIEVMKKLKRLFDPDNIMNPGKIFPEDKE